MNLSTAMCPKMSREELEEHLQNFFKNGGAIARPRGPRAPSKSKIVTQNRQQREAKGIEVETQPPKFITRSSK